MGQQGERGRKREKKEESEKNSGRDIDNKKKNVTVYTNLLRKPVD
jgi:hypothetical protein